MWCTPPQDGYAGIVLARDDRNGPNANAEHERGDGVAASGRTDGTAPNKTRVRPLP